MGKPLLYRILRPIISFLFKIIYRPKIINNDYIPKDSKVILSGNHTNILDCLLLISCTKRTVHFLAKDELVKGWKKFIFIPFGIIPVNRKIHDKNALNKAIKYLNEDKVIGIFPEGTINRTNDIILPFKYGAVKMSKSTSSLLVPFVIKGKYKIFKKSNLSIKFLKPYKVVNDLELENKKLENIIIKNLKGMND